MEKQPQRGADVEPLVDAAPARAWREWLSLLFATAKARVAGATVLLLFAIVAGSAGLWLFGELSSEVMRGETQALDNSVYLFLRQSASPALDSFARFVSLLGSEAVAVLLLGLVVLFLVRRRWGTAVSLLLVTRGAQLLNNVLKDHFHRTRPAPVTHLLAAQRWSFPSGHAMVAAAFYLFLAYIGWRLLRPLARVVWAALMATLVLLIGWSRLYLGAHFLTDVIAGYAAGAIWTDAVIVAGHLLQLTHRRVSTRTPSPSPGTAAPPGGTHTPGTTAASSSEAAQAAQAAQADGPRGAAGGA